MDTILHYHSTRLGRLDPQISMKKRLMQAGRQQPLSEEKEETQEERRGYCRTQEMREKKKFGGIKRTLFVLLLWGGRQKELNH